MDGSDAVGRSGGDERTVTLSTGDEVELPLFVEFSMAGALFPASYERLRARLPSDRLSPIRIAPRTGVVAFAAIEYHETDVGPYEEFGVIVPVAEVGERDRSDADGSALGGALSRLVDRSIGGYVSYLPVTTGASVALGREIWGYPKEIADVEIRAVDGGRRATVSEGGERILSLAVGAASGRERSATLHSYSTLDGDLVRTRADLSGALAVRPLSQQASVTLGEHERADDLRELGLRRWSVGRLYGDDLSAQFHPGERRPL